MDSAHLVRQLRFVVPGGAATYVLGTLEKMRDVWESGAARCVIWFAGLWAVRLNAARDQAVIRYFFGCGLDHCPALPLHTAYTRHQGHPTKRAYSPFRIMNMRTDSYLGRTVPQLARIGRAEQRYSRSDGEHHRGLDVSGLCTRPVFESGVFEGDNQLCVSFMLF